MNDIEKQKIKRLTLVHGGKVNIREATIKILQEDIHSLQSEMIYKAHSILRIEAQIESLKKSEVFKDEN